MLKPVQLRMAIVRNPDKSIGEKAFAVAELVCFPLSFLMFIFVVFDFGFSFLGVNLYEHLPQFWMRKLVSVLVAAAIGYVTNWLAIMMLFRPYDQTKWLFVWPQGLIPRNKPKMAREMGRMVGTKLLSPEKLVEEFCSKIRNYLASPDVINIFRREMQQLLGKHQNDIVEFVAPEVGKSVGLILDRNLTPNQIIRFWESTILPKLNDQQNREVLAKNIVEIISRNAPELVKSIRCRLRDHLNERISIDVVVDLVMEFFADEESIENLISNWLGNPATHSMFKDKMLVIGEKINYWMKSEDGVDKIARFTQEMREKADVYLQEYVRTALPKLIASAFDSERLWGWVENSLLPGVRERIIAFIVDNKKAILSELRIAERVEAAINKQSVREFHEMLDRLAAQHLSAIQVLGYVLGAVVGALQRCS